MAGKRVFRNEAGFLLTIKYRMKILNYIPSWLKNKYLLSGAFFLTWMFYFDPKDLKSTLSKRTKYQELLKSEKASVKLINDTRQELSQLKTSAETIERYARENYLMKKDNEDLFIVIDENSTK